MAQASWHALMCEGMRWRRLKKPAQAMECLVQAIEITCQSPDLTRETGSILNYLAELYLQEGQLVQAEATIRRALQIHLGLPFPEKTLAADDLVILAKVLTRRARFSEALEVGRQALDLLRRQHGTHDALVAQLEEIVDDLGRKNKLPEWQGPTSNDVAKPATPARKAV